MSTAASDAPGRGLARHGTIQATEEAPAWLRRRLGAEEYLAKVEEAIVKARDPEAGADYLAAKAELARLRSEIATVETPIKEAAGVDALAAAATATGGAV